MKVFEGEKNDGLVDGGSMKKVDGRWRNGGWS